MISARRHPELLMLAVFVLHLACGRVPVEGEDANPPVRPEAGNSATRSDLFYTLEWSSHNVTPTLKRGSSRSVEVLVKNKGDQAWPDPKSADPKGDGSYAIRLGYRWLGPDGLPITQYEARADLASAVPAGGTARFSMDVIAPAEPGRYTLQFDLVEELVVWFEAKGVPKLLVPVTIE